MNKKDRVQKIIDKLTAATGEPFARVTDHPSLKGDLCSLDHSTVHIKCKYRGNLEERAVVDGHSVITRFLDELDHLEDPAILILTTGGGAKGKKNEIDWLFVQVDKQALKGDFYPWRKYAKSNVWIWAYAKLDDVLPINGSVNLFLCKSWKIKEIEKPDGFAACFEAKLEE